MKGQYKMNFIDLEHFLDENLLKLQAKYGFRNKEDVSLWVKSLKLSEEVGEFSENILKYLSYQRKEKLDVDILEEIKEEYADVIITASLILKELELDISEALAKKINKISGRGGV